MGSNCSSLRRNGKKDNESEDNGPLNGSSDLRKSSNRSVDSLPYGRSSPPPSSAKSSHEEPVSQLNGETLITEAPPTINAPLTPAKEDSNFLGPPSKAVSPCPSSPCPSSQTPSPYTTPSPTNIHPSLSPTGLYSYTQLFSIKDDNNHMIAISLESDELIVWDIYSERAVRTLRGISQPRDVKMIDRYRAIVLCNRELKLYNLDSGTLETKLKGVMNQKMPYFGLHEDNYVVALSRNRMYVNMINSKTGDLETTFKAGEDRFLNSLLVSANGKICVCGDETQKPFPLLVWDLANRKLLYDLRIPHHEFITRLSAISNEGHYVVSVCKEMNTSSANFIIVYELLSGTLFKKWKPECNSVSIAISTQSGFVMNGVESGDVLVWDLSTGNKKYTLSGHTSSPDVLQATEEGNMFLSYDSTGKDRSIRIWELDSGTCLTVYTPDSQISCCRLSPDGKALVVSFLSSMKLSTVSINKRISTEISKTTTKSTYGDSERDGQVFDLTKV